MGRTLKVGEPCVCDCCKHIAIAELISVSHGHKKALCKECATVYNYDGREREKPKHRPNVDSWHVGMELEMLAYPVLSQEDMDKKHAAASTAFFSGAPEHDASLDTTTVKGIEYHYDIKNLCGLKSTLSTIYSIYGDCMTDDHAGDHINVSYDNMSEYDFTEIRVNRERIFRPLISYMQSHENNTRHVFGRFFTHYATAELKCEHYDGFSIRDNRIEFRVAKFQSVSQYVQLVNLCLDMVRCIRNNFCYNNYDPHKADITANKLVLLFQKYADGEAQCQKPERNTKD